MIKKRICVFCLCLPILAALTGCADGEVQSTVSEVVSRLGEDMNETLSRAESALESMDGIETVSGLDNEDASGMESNLDSGLDNDLDSGLDSGLNGDDDYGNLDSDLADDGVVDEDGGLTGDDESSAAVTRDR